MSEAMNGEQFSVVPYLGELFVFGPDNRKLQVIGLDLNEYSGELSIRMRPYEPAMAANKPSKLGLRQPELLARAMKQPVKDEPQA